jgi:RNA polymerase sigma factor (sigma-70 family)
MSSSDGSITRWFEGLKSGDRAAVGPLWDEYFARMVALARAALRPGTPGLAVADEEDAALSAFQSFCAGAVVGRFAHLSGREELWRLLAVITVRKARAQVRRQRRRKRGGGQVLRETDLGAAIEDIPTPGQGPDVAVLAAEELARLLDRLGDETLRRVAVWRMEGYRCEEIAERLGCSRRTVARQLALVRKLWAEDLAFDPE